MTHLGYYYRTTHLTTRLIHQHDYSIPPVGIRRLQIALLKIALILGVKVQLGLEFTEIVPPSRERNYYSVRCRPGNALAHAAFFAIVGAQGTSATLPGSALLITIFLLLERTCIA